LSNRIVKDAVFMFYIVIRRKLEMSIEN
jgi:hypothetical protein